MKRSELAAISLCWVALLGTGCAHVVNVDTLDSEIRINPVPAEDVLVIVRDNPKLVDHALMSLVCSSRADRCDPALWTAMFNAKAKAKRTYGQLIDGSYTMADWVHETAFEKAVSKCPASSLELFLQRWPDIASQPQAGLNAVRAASKAKPEEVAERMAVFRLLRARGARFTFQPGRNHNRSLREETPWAIHFAADGCEAHHLELMEALLADRVNVNTRDGYGRTALHRAAQNGCLAMARLLLKAGAQPNIATYEGATALNDADNNFGPARNAMKALLKSGGAVATSDAERDQLQSRENRASDLYLEDRRRWEAERDAAYRRRDEENRREALRLSIQAEAQTRSWLAGQAQREAQTQAIIQGQPWTPPPVVTPSGEGSKPPGGGAQVTPPKPPEVVHPAGGGAAGGDNPLGGGLITTIAKDPKEAAAAAERERQAKLAAEQAAAEARKKEELERERRAKEEEQKRVAERLAAESKARSERCKAARESRAALGRAEAQCDADCELRGSESSKACGKIDGMGAWATCITKSRKASESCNEGCSARFKPPPLPDECQPKGISR